jgi:hypothetical protein
MREKKQRDEAHRGHSEGERGQVRVEPLTVRFANWAVRNVALGILGTLLSTAAIAGAAYLLYGAQHEIDEQNKVIQEFRADSIAWKRASEMRSIYSAGWFSKKENNDHLYQLIQAISARQTQPELDPQLVRSQISWCTDAVAVLISEEGQIGAFDINDKFVAKHQSLLVAYYASTREIIDSASGIIRSWKEDAAGTRKQKLQNMAGKVATAMKAEASLTGFGKQIKDYGIQKDEDSRENFEAAQHKYREIEIKKYLSITGLVAGIIILLVSILILARQSSGIRRVG